MLTEQKVKASPKKLLFSLAGFNIGPKQVVMRKLEN